MNLPGWGWHALSDDLNGYLAVSVNDNWRMTFTFEGTYAVLVDYMDRHLEPHHDPYPMYAAGYSEWPAAEPVEHLMLALA